MFSEAVGVLQAVRTGPLRLEVMKRSGDVVIVDTEKITHLKLL
ncbi:MAG: hypothetical protein ABR505_02110 [Actinomycetota bacterium]